jgi:transglutaminase-like putative cysteine protease
MRYCIFILLIVVLYINLAAENYLLNGGQKSNISYKLRQQIDPTPQTVTIDITFVMPKTFISPTYKQEIKDLNISFSLNPDDRQEREDKHGNRVIKYSWSKPKRSFNAEINFISINSVSLYDIKTTAPFPLENIPQELGIYLMSSTEVPCDNEKIIKIAENLVKNAKTQFDAVQKILTWIIDHMQYVLTPEEHGALFSVQHGKGNCQNYSHLAAALMRASGIPVRIVNGITLKRPYDVNIGNQVLTLNMAQGRHSWIEVYFSDLGWMPFDPQQTELFVSNRFIRVEVGRANEETVNDGLVRWTREKGSQEMLSFHETIEAEFLNDEVQIKGNKQQFGPRKLLLQPMVEALFIPVETPVVEKPPVVEPEQIMKMKFEIPYTYGNLEFPEGVNFAFIRDSKESELGRTHELQKNFMVETAEYVTSRLQYAQIFYLNRPLQLQKIGIALHKFGGEGKLWLELREDMDGFPGPVSARSSKVDLKQLSLKPGYFWVDFDFDSQGLLLTPDKYWITLGYSGSPIVNWFYSYGKPVGPIDGTRYKEKSDQRWSNNLGFEFNYRVVGLTPTF